MRDIILEEINFEKQKRIIQRLIKMCLTQEYVINCSLNNKTEKLYPTGIGFFLSKGYLFMHLIIKCKCEDWMKRPMPDPKLEIKNNAKIMGIEIEEPISMYFKKGDDILKWYAKTMEENYIDKYFVFIRPNRKIGDYNFIFNYRKSHTE
jgi:hypothetical protein